MRIIFILADALRSDHLSCYHGKVETPNIDEIAQNGTLFQNFFSNSNATEPCVTSILTGQYPHTHGILMHPRISTYDEISKQTIKRDVEKNHLCTLLREKLYRTFLVDNLSMFNRQYFDEYIEVKEGLRHPDNAEKTTDAAISILDYFFENCFIFIHYWNTHHPYFPSYAGEVAKLDKAVGRLVQHTDLDNDIIIFTADHGESIGEHVTEARVNDPGHHHLYDEIIHIPLIISSEFSSRITVTDMREQIDIAPTIMDMVNGKGIFSKRAHTLLKKLDKKEIFLEEHTYQEQLGLRTTEIKFIEKLKELPCSLCNTIHGNARYECYDLISDPQEKENLAPFSDIELLYNLHTTLQDWYNHGEEF